MTRLFLLSGAVAMAFVQWLIFFYAPVEASMGLSQKIFYLHLPLAWWGLCSFLIVFLCSISVLRSRSRKASCLARACAETGELLAVLTVFTGMIWGRVAWGIWWTWDPRLTTALILCFIYAGYLLLQTLDMPGERRETISAVTGILAFLDVPLVFVSARIWRSIHPAVFSAQGIAMSPEMFHTVLAAICAFGVFVTGLIRLRYRMLMVERRMDDLSLQHFE